MLLQLQDYIQKRQVVSLAELATHFHTSPAVIEPILRQLIHKGRLQKVTSSHCGGCHSCGSPTLELYEWRTNHAIPSNDQSAQ